MDSLDLILRLRRIEDLFEEPDITPFSEWYEIYSERSGIGYVLDELSDTPDVDTINLTIRLPDADITDGLALKVERAVAKYCRARLRAIEEKWDTERARNLRMLLFAICSVALLVTVSHLLSRIDSPGVDVVAEGLSIASWVMLWYPLQNLVFTRWEHRADRRVLLALEESIAIRIQPLEDEGAAADSLTPVDSGASDPAVEAQPAE